MWLWNKSQWTLIILVSNYVQTVFETDHEKEKQVLRGIQNNVKRYAYFWSKMPMWYAGILFFSSNLDNFVFRLNKTKNLENPTNAQM